MGVAKGPVVTVAVDAVRMTRRSRCLSKRKQFIVVKSARERKREPNRSGDPATVVIGVSNLNGHARKRKRGEMPHNEKFAVRFRAHPKSHA